MSNPSCIDAVGNTPLSPLEVEYSDGEGEDESKQQSETDDGDGHHAQEVVPEPKIPIDEIFHFFSIFHFIHIVPVLRSHEPV